MGANLGPLRPRAASSLRCQAVPDAATARFALE